MQIMSCKKNVLRTFAFLLILCMVSVTFAGCGENDTASNAYRSVNGAVLESQTLASNSNYELLWDNGGQSIVFKSLKNGEYWSDILYDAFLEGSTSANGNSPISITVANTKTLEWDTVTSYSQIGDNGSIVCKKIDGGIRVTYFFDRYKIAVPVDYILNDDSLKIVVDSSKILENGTDYKLISVSVAPFLCSVKNDAENGSVFVPSGTGAIMYSAEMARNTRKYIGEVYGMDAGRRNPLNLVDSEEIKLPVFGAYGDGKGIMGIIEQGAGATKIEAQAGNSKLGYSNVGATFYVRGYDSYVYIYHGKYKGITDSASENISGQTLSISYYPLFGENADYAGMAEKYRNYLIEKGQLKQTKEKSSAYAVTLLGGTNITTSIFGIPNSKLVSLTTFSQAQNIINELNENTKTLPTVRMMGYGDKGIRTGSIIGGKNYSSVYGSKKQLTSLLQSCKDALMFFDYEVVKFSKSNLGFSINFDVAKTAISHKAVQYPVTPLRVNDKDNAYYIIARDRLDDSVKSALDKAENYGIPAVSFSSLGSIAFSDFSDNNYMNKNGIENDVADILSNASSNGYKTAVADANCYAACAADILFDTPTGSGAYDAFDIEVPFYQMVFHSYKTMYTSAVNLEENTSLAIAKAAACGMGLGYTLSYNYVDKSDDLDEFALYGTVYSDNSEQIYETLVENGYVELYSAIADAELVSYELDQNGVSKSGFSNGKVIYVNQSSKKASCPVGELEPYAFFVS